jgi:rare lipoprotein A (peptidoglycan hydrolase)
MSYSVNLDYTGTGRVEVKIQVIADNHVKAFKTAQNILNQQKSWYRKHKEEARADQNHYKKLLQYGPDYSEPQQHEPEEQRPRQLKLSEF